MSIGFGLTASFPVTTRWRASTYAEIVSDLAGYELELMFVDDGSADGTLDKIRELAATDSRVQYISFARNFGLEAAFSAGYRYAGKPWVAPRRGPAVSAGRGSPFGRASGGWR